MGSASRTLLMIRALGIVGVILSNTIMWILYSRALRLCSSSVVATVTNTSSNFLFTAFVGWLLFGETLPIMWWCGSIFILIGLIFIHTGSKDDVTVCLMKTD